MKEESENQSIDKAFTEECTKVLNAVSDTLYAVGGKWKLMIIISIARGNKRFTELQRQVTGISSRVLSSELKDLEINGFVEKKVTAIVGYPVQIEYHLTEYSHTLEDVVAAMTAWGIQHREKIKNDWAAQQDK
jgi:DNA-binding HxlR family transcriptional regulator